MRCAKDGIQCVYSVQKPTGRPRKQPKQQDAQLPGAEEQALPKSAQMTLEEYLEYRQAVDPALFDGLQLLHPISFEAGGVDYLRRIELSFDLSTLYANPDSLDRPTGDQTGSETTQSSLEAALSPARDCSCLSRISSSLLSLSTLPDCVEDVLRLTRLASKTVYQTSSCPSCCVDAEPVSKSSGPSRVSLLLAVLLPAIATGYSKALQLVEFEVARAQMEQRQLVFSLGKYGGLWGNREREQSACETSHSNATMSAFQWRATIRALIRADVYGCESQGAAGDERVSTHHWGLWNFLEEVRACEVDAIEESPYPNDVGLWRSVQGPEASTADHNAYDEKRHTELSDVIDKAAAILEDLKIA